jgi:hypothetical protein
MSYHFAHTLIVKIYSSIIRNTPWNSENLTPCGLIPIRILKVYIEKMREAS